MKYHLNKETLSSQTFDMSGRRIALLSVVRSMEGLSACDIERFVCGGKWNGERDSKRDIEYCVLPEARPQRKGCVRNEPGRMKISLDDRQSVSDLMMGWMYRDLAEWDKLRSLFYPDGTIEVTWFEGKFSDFVDASIMRMGASDLRTKHVITSPVVTFNGNKAIAETNAIIVGDNAKFGVGAEQHSRFYDRLEKRDGVWKIVDRRCIYDMGTFMFSGAIVELDTATLERFPRKYAPLAYLLEKSGFPLKRVFPTKGSDLEKQIKAEGQSWLKNANLVEGA